MFLFLALIFLILSWICVIKIDIFDKKFKYRAMMLLNGRIVDSQLNFSFDDFGKTVFLTKEEAEQALAEMKKGGKE